MPEAFYTVDEAARRLRMHPDTLRRQLRQGRIPSVRTGKFWRIPESAFDAPGLAPAAPFTPGELSPDALAALFAPPTPEEIARRLEALDAFKGDGKARTANATPVTDDAVAQGYEERAAQIMEGHR